MRLTSSKVRVLTLRKTLQRRSAQKPATTWVRHQVPAVTDPNEMTVTNSILPRAQDIVPCGGD